jgi:hypothetical protein
LGRDRSSVHFAQAQAGAIGTAHAESRLDAVIVPEGDDQNVYLVVDDLGRNVRVYREIDVEAADLETVILDLLSGQYKDPARVVAFNTFEGWSQDVSGDIAQELHRRCDVQMRDVPYDIHEFVERHYGLDRQLTLRLA